MGANSFMQPSSAFPSHPPYRACANFEFIAWRTKSKASLSQGYFDSAMVVQLLDFAIRCCDSGIGRTSGARTHKSTGSDGHKQSSLSFGRHLGERSRSRIPKTSRSKYFCTVTDSAIDGLPEVLRQSGLPSITTHLALPQMGTSLRADLSSNMPAPAPVRQSHGNAVARSRLVVCTLRLAYRRGWSVKGCSVLQFWICYCFRTSK